MTASRPTAAGDGAQPPRGDAVVPGGGHFIVAAAVIATLVIGRLMGSIDPDEVIRRHVDETPLATAGLAFDPRNNALPIFQLCSFLGVTSPAIRRGHLG